MTPRQATPRGVADAIAAMALAIGASAAAAPPVELADVAAGMGGFTILGINQNDESGYSVSGAGDVNGDGLADVIVGAFLADPGGRLSAGESYVVFGKRDTAAVNLAAVVAGVGGFAILGIDAGDESGSSVSGAGDVNGDGLADLIVGAALAEEAPGTDNGAAYVVFGKADTTPVELATIAAGSGGFIIRGNVPEDLAGTSVSGAGDVNGDGLDDLIVGAPGANPGSAGQTYVVFGKANTNAVHVSSVVAGNGGFAIDGASVADQAGFDVAGAGDVNGDGLDDVVIGALLGDPGGEMNAGEAYVVFGKAGTALVSLADVAAGVGGFLIEGIVSGDLAGWSVDGAGDANGDGLDDVIVGAPHAAPGGAFEAGESYVVFGKADGAVVDLAEFAAGTGAGYLIAGVLDAGDHNGRCVSGAGDVNGDGLDDVVIGARSGDPHGVFEAGQAYVVYGKADATPVDLSIVESGTGGFVMNGIDTTDVAGWGVSGAGDVNGDGLPDVIVGAPRADPGGTSRAGESYVVFAQPCIWDCGDSDGQVGIADLLALLAAWGGSGPCDVDEDGVVGIGDLLDLLAVWDQCG